MKTEARVADQGRLRVGGLGPEGILLPIGALGVLTGLLTLGALLS